MFLTISLYMQRQVFNSFSDTARIDVKLSTKYNTYRFHNLPTS